MSFVLFAADNTQYQLLNTTTTTTTAPPNNNNTTCCESSPITRRQSESAAALNQLDTLCNSSSTTNDKLSLKLFLDLPLDGQWYRKIHCPLSLRLKMPAGNDKHWQRVLESARGQLPNGLAPWRAKITLKDAQHRPLNQNEVQALVGKPISEVDLRPTADGTALEGVSLRLRFSQTSKRFGGHLWISSELTAAPADLLAATTSTPSSLTIKAKRNGNIKPVEECDPWDSLTVVKGLGDVYVAKFAKIGVKTLRDLGDLPTPGSEADPTGHHFREMINKVRKAGGKSPTEFERLIRDARRRVQHCS